MQATQNSPKLLQSSIFKSQANDEMNMVKPLKEHSFSINKDKELKNNEDRNTNFPKNQKLLDSQKQKEQHHEKDPDRHHSHKEKENSSGRADSHEKKHMHHHNKLNTKHTHKHHERAFVQIDQNNSLKWSENPLNKNAKDDILCYYCGILGHSSYECKESNSNAHKKRCFNCRNEGQQSNDCYLKKSLQDNNPKDRMETHDFSSNTIPKNDLGKIFSEDFSRKRNGNKIQFNRKRENRFHERRFNHNNQNYHRDNNKNFSRQNENLHHRSRSRSHEKW